jgi:predicted glycosyltransferase
MLTPTARTLNAGADPLPTGSSVRRIALYSHDTQGLGHIRRNLGIAGALSRRAQPPDILLLSGVREARAFALPTNTDCLTLPSFRKDPSGRYGARSLSMSLDQLIELRAQTIKVALEMFDPQVLVVDKVARGAFGELEPALEELARRPSTRVVLGVRDVLDDAFAARREWHETATTEAVDEFYDAVWVYGDPAVYDPVTEYGLPPSVAAKIRFTGYLTPPVAHAYPPIGPTAGPYDLCLVGGGQDGHRIAAAFLAAHRPDGTAAVVVTGPYMDAEARAQLAALAARRPGRYVLGFVDDCAGLIHHARAVVAMGGYNTTLELLAHGVRTLIVPRVRPRREQLVRAERLAALGLVDVCHPDTLTPQGLARWLAPGTPDPLPGRGPATSSTWTA